MQPQAARDRFDAWRRAVLHDWWSDDPHLSSLLRVYRPELDPAAIADFARVCAHEIDALAVENNRDEHLPVLRRYDGRGNRIEAVDHHPSYHEIGRRMYGAGLMARYAEPGRELESLAQLYLFSQNGEAGQACPAACTAGLVKILQAAGNPRPDWLERLLASDGESHWRGAQFLTEVQGGSDVGANAVRAEALPDEPGWHAIHGEKWFCSVIDADLFLMTARDSDQGGTAGLGAFVVPRVLDDGQTNSFHVRRLKYKLGTRSMASAEVDFVGARGLRVGDFKLVMQHVISTSRVYNAICSTGMLQRAAREALCYARAREAFGQPILAFPTTARIVARRVTEAYAARASTFHLVDLGDRRSRGGTTEQADAAHRMLVNLNKFWTSVSATTAVRDAIEVLGGNGAIEEFSVLPRLLRDAIVCEAWEGGHNVLCAQVLRDSQRLGLHEPMFDWIEAHGGAGDPELARLRERWGGLVALDARDATVHIRDLCEALRPVTQAALLRHEVASGGTDPKARVAAEHLATTQAPAYDPLDDGGLVARVGALLGP